MGAASTSTDDSECVTDAVSRHDDDVTSHHNDAISSRTFEETAQQLEEDLRRLPGAKPVKQVC